MIHYAANFMQTKITSNHILIIEDYDTDRELMQVNFTETLSNPVIFARDGAEAMAWLDKHTPMLIILDLGLPGIPGLKLLEKIHHLCPVIVLTGSRESKDIIAANGIGINAYLTKPITFSDMLKAIRRIPGFEWTLTYDPTHTAR